MPTPLPSLASLDISGVCATEPDTSTPPGKHDVSGHIPAELALLILANTTCGLTNNLVETLISDEHVGTVHFTLLGELEYRVVATMEFKSTRIRYPSGIDYHNRYWEFKKQTLEGLWNWEFSMKLVNTDSRTKVEVEANAKPRIDPNRALDKKETIMKYAFMQLWSPYMQCLVFGSLWNVDTWSYLQETEEAVRRPSDPTQLTHALYARTIQCVGPNNSQYMFSDTIAIFEPGDWILFYHEVKCNALYTANPKYPLRLKLSKRAQEYYDVAGLRQRATVFKQLLFEQSVPASHKCSTRASTPESALQPVKPTAAAAESSQMFRLAHRQNLRGPYC